MKHVLLSLFIFFCLLTVRAQTLVNTTIIDTIGHVVISQNFQTAFADFDNLQAVGVFNQYATGLPETFSVMKVDFSTGLTDWNINFDTLSAFSDFANAVKIKGDYAYLAAFSWDSASNYAEFATLKLRMTDGSIVWKRIYNGPYNGYDIPADIVIDNAENVYVVGTEQTDSLDYAFTAIKYDSTGTQQWVSHYDSLGYYDGAVAASFGPTGGVLAVTGFSGSGYTNWDFQTMYFSFTDGHTVAQNRSANASGALSRPVDIEKDLYGNFYLLGTSAMSMGNTDFKLIKYDASFNEVWVRTWGDSLLPDTATALLVDFFSGDCYVTGIRAKLGGTNAPLLRYNTDGDLLWTRQLMGADPLNVATGAELYMNDEADQVYLTGKIFNGTDNDILAARFDTSGKLIWQKNFGRTIGSDDEGVDMFLENGDLVISAISKATDTLYLGIKFEQHEVTDTTVTDSFSNPIYMANELIVRLNPDIINPEFSNNANAQFALASSVLPDSIIDSMSLKTGLDFSKTYIKKIFTDLTPEDSLSISRYGDTILLPKLWTAFVLLVPGNGKPKWYEPAIADTLATMFPAVFYAHLNYIGTKSNSANDTYYTSTTASYNQSSLIYNPTISPDGDPSINIEQAWNYESGIPGVHVGIFDGSLDYTHEDFKSITNPNNSRVRGAFNFINNTNEIASNNIDFDNHSTACAGIIGATTNNNTGVAGIAGGGFNTSGSGVDDGVSLYGFNVFGPDLILDRYIDALFRTCVRTTRPQQLYAYTMDIANCSLGISEDEIYSQLYPSSTPQLLKEITNQTYRSGVTLICSRGNGGCGIPIPVGNNSKEFPACISEDDWVITVAGSGNDGLEASCSNSNTGETSISKYGDGVDITAPFSIENIYTTFPNNQYDNFHRTSAAAPHVSGVAALLLSNNRPWLFTNHQLYTEDVQNIIKYTSTYNGGNPDYGYGRLNAGAALQFYNTANIEHYRAYSDLPTVTGPTVTNDIDVYLNENITDGYHGSILLQSNSTTDPYLADKYQFKYTFTTDLVSTVDHLDYYWVNNSRSDLFGELDGGSLLDPYAHMYISNIDETGPYIKVEVTGNVYYVHATHDDYSTPLTNPQWIPFDATTAADLSQTDIAITLVSNAPTGIKPLTAMEQIKVSCYPQPTGDFNILQLQMKNSANIQVDLYDLMGQKINAVFNGYLNAGSNTFKTDASVLSPGMYCYRVKTDGFNTSLKFIKQ